MPANVPLTLYEKNTEKLSPNITNEAGSSPEDLTSATVEVYFKDSADTADSDVSVTKLVSPTDVTIVDAANGACQFRVPTAVVAAPGTKFWRCDVLTEAGATRRTAMHGTVTITNL